jgi:hypothetical protein
MLVNLLVFRRESVDAKEVVIASLGRCLGRGSTAALAGGLVCAHDGMALGSATLVAKILLLTCRSRLLQESPIEFSSPSFKQDPDQTRKRGAGDFDAGLERRGPKWSSDSVCCEMTTHVGLAGAAGGYRYCVDGKVPLQNKCHVVENFWPPRGI